MKSRIKASHLTPYPSFSTHQLFIIEPCHFTSLTMMKLVVALAALIVVAQAQPVEENRQEWLRQIGAVEENRQIDAKMEAQCVANPVFCVENGITWEAMCNDSPLLEVFQANGLCE